MISNRKTNAFVGDDHGYHYINSMAIDRVMINTKRLLVSVLWQDRAILPEISNIHITYKNEGSRAFYLRDEVIVKFEGLTLSQSWIPKLVIQYPHHANPLRVFALYNCKRIEV